MKKTFAVIGLGKFGSHVAMTLEQLGHMVLAFDKDEKAVEKMRDYVTHASILDSTDKKALEESGLVKCDVALVSIGHSTANNFLTVLNLNEIGVRAIIAKAQTIEEGRILEKIGATKVVYPERESAIRLANQLVTSDILEFIEISPDYQASEINAPWQFIGKTIEELNTMKNYKVLVLAIRTGDKTVIIPPQKEVIKKDNVIVVVGQTRDVIAFIKKFNGKSK
jgi:trk system potassium uptake protein TrkA